MRETALYFVRMLNRVTDSLDTPRKIAEFFNAVILLVKIANVSMRDFLKSCIY